jgi:hypothetical protein
MPPAPNHEPIEIVIRMYQVGFGDCFVLTFRYAEPLADGRDVRHVLIDFGSTRPAGQTKDLVAVANAIHDQTQGQIDVVVVSHRHKDHLSGFGTREGPLLGMQPGFPRLVVRSWTEHPTLDRAAKGPAAVAATRAAGPMSAAVGRKSSQFVDSLRAAEQFAEDLRFRVQGAAPNSLPAELKQLVDDQISNKEAVDQLAAWATAGTGAYLHYGMASGIEAVVPGITVRVIGPPTVNQHPAVAKQKSRDPNEFWMIYGAVLKNLRAKDLVLRDVDPDDPGSAAPTGASDADGADPALASTMAMTAAIDDAPAASPVKGAQPTPGPVKWLTDRLGRQQVNSLLRIVRILDDVLNNTSVILLVDVPCAGPEPLRLLFGGDAQIENWEYALKFADDHQANLDLLRNVDVYKVGHHGSRNATPRTLFNLWNEPATKKRPMTALMSTKFGVHGKTEATKVPRKTLVAALDTRMTPANFYETVELQRGVWWVEIAADLTKGKAFSDRTPPPPSAERRTRARAAAAGGRSRRAAQPTRAGRRAGARSPQT